MPGRYQTTGNSLTKKQWSAFLHQETQDQRFFTNEWIGAPLIDAGTVDEKPTGRPVFEKSDFRKESGDRVRLPMEKPLTDIVAAGNVKLSNVTDNREEAQAYNYLDVFIDEYRKAVLVESPMTEQRTEFKIRSRAVPLLKRWLAQQRDDGIFTAFRYGYNFQLLQSQGVSNNTQGGQFALIDHPNKIWNDGSAASSFGDAGRLLATTGNAVFSQQYLDFLILEAETRNMPKINHKGQGYWIMIVSPKQYETLLKDTDLKAIWTEGSSTRAMGFAAGANPDIHPFLRSANLVYRDILIMKSNKIVSPQDVTGEFAASGGGAISWTDVSYANSLTQNKVLTFSGIGAGASGTTLANSDLNEALFLGAEAIGTAFGRQKAEMHRKKEDDYGYLFGNGVAEIAGSRRADFVDEDDTPTFLNQSSFSVISYVGT